METALVVLAVGVLFGGMVLMLTMGFLNAERERAQQAKAGDAVTARRPATLVTVPGFFSRPERAMESLDIIFDDDLVNRIEHHVRLEQAVVAQFVHHPSVDNLYRESGAPVHIH
jgi:hypothetical protein